MKYQDVYSTSIHDLLELYIQGSTDRIVNVVVIGANNGDINDFISGYLRNPNIRGVLVEPVNYLYQQLQEKFKEYKNLSFENSAICKNCGKREFYRINKTPTMPDWSEGLGSLHQSIIHSHSLEINDITDFILTDEVQCINLEMLLEKYQINPIHILQVDAEGHDFEIINLINFKDKRPDIIIYEYMHLTFYQYYGLINLLERENYNVKRSRTTMDIIAVDNLIL